MERVNERIKQMLSIAKRYNDPKYVSTADKNSDVVQGSNFAYEILKEGIEVNQLRALLDLHKKGLSSDAGSVLEGMVARGVIELVPQDKKVYH